jgi:hypothetical protein
LWDSGTELSQSRTPFVCAPGRIRTCDTRFRKPVLYPLSYEGSLIEQLNFDRPANAFDI